MKKYEKDIDKQDFIDRYGEKKDHLSTMRL